MDQHKGQVDRAGDVAEVVDQLRALTATYFALGQDFASRHALHPTDMEALLHLMDADEAGMPATPGRLGEALGLASGSVTGLIDRLERAGHVQRTRDTKDRRRVIVVPSESALAAGREYWGAIDRHISQALGQYSPPELAAVRRFLTEMTDIAAQAQRTEVQELPRHGV